MSFLKMLKSLFSAVLGVRSQKDAEADFAEFDYRWYVVLGFVIVLFVVCVLILLVRWVM